MNHENARSLIADACRSLESEGFDWATSEKIAHRANDLLDENSRGIDKRSVSRYLTAGKGPIGNVVTAGEKNGAYTKWVFESIEDSE